MVELGTRRTYRKGAGRKLSACRLRASHFYPEHTSSFDISCSIFDIQNQPSRRQKTASQIEKETLALCYRRVGHRADRYWRARWPALLHENSIEIHEVSYKRRLWPRASSLIIKKLHHCCPAGVTISEPGPGKSLLPIY
jgi:hypothetical protein